MGGSDDNMEAAMLLEDEQLAKVNNDADAQLAETPLSPASAIKAQKEKDTEMKDVTTKPDVAKSQRTKPKSIVRQKTPIANPSVAVSSNAASNSTSDAQPKKDDDHKRNGSFFE